VSESAKDLSTTSLGLVAAYVLPGAIALGVLGYFDSDIGKFLLKDGEHLTFATALAISLGLLLNGLRTAVFSRWLLHELSFKPSDFKDIDKDAIPELQAAVDEVFRLHQFYSALFFLFPAFCIVWVMKEWSQLTSWQWILIEAGLLLVWRVIAIGVLENYEFYHQIAKGILKKTPTAPTGYKAWIIGILFEWKFWDKYGHG
jgi:NhaP-type Na+/H+ or K+/H+ antiporter